MLTSPNIQAAAAAAKVGERTLHTWLKEPTFQAALASEEARVIDAAARQLVTLAESAVQTVKEILDDPKAAQSLRLRAAAQALNNLMDLRQLTSIEERLQRLEAEMETNHGR